MLFFHYFSLVLSSQTHKSLQYCFVVICNNISDVIFQEKKKKKSFSDSCWLVLKRESQNAKSQKADHVISTTWALELCSPDSTRTFSTRQDRRKTWKDLRGQ